MAGGVDSSAPQPLMAQLKAMVSVDRSRDELSQLVAFAKRGRLRL